MSAEQNKLPIQSTTPIPHIPVLTDASQKGNIVTPTMSQNEITFQNMSPTELADFCYRVNKELSTRYHWDSLTLE
jgi:hypothetical protein